MKKLVSLSALLSLFLFSSCGTIITAIKHGKSEVFMIEAPNDLQVTANGEKLDLSSEVFAASGRIGSDVTTTYYTGAVKLPHNKKATLELYSPSKNKRATVELKPRTYGIYVFLDILFTAGGGLIVDYPTGGIKILKPRLVDVHHALEGKTRKQWRSQGKLKRMTKRKIKKG